MSNTRVIRDPAIADFHHGVIGDGSASPKPKGRFFSGDGSKGQTSLELHGVTLKNGNAADVSKRLMYFTSIFEHI